VRIGFVACVVAFFVGSAGFQVTADPVPLSVVVINGAEGGQLSARW